MAFIAAGILIFIHATLFVVGIGIKIRLSAISKKHSELLSQKRESEALKTQMDAIDKKIDTINGLVVKRFSWAAKLNSLGDSIVPGVWLSELSYDEKIPERTVRQTVVSDEKKKPIENIAPKTVLRCLTITGYAVGAGEQGTADIAKFMNGLKDNKAFYEDFSDIELVSAKSDKVDAQEVMNFKINCLFKAKK
jgi:hypothetical protein